MINFFQTEKPPKRYLRQLESVEEFVLHDTKLKKERLHEILDVLYEYRIID
ncbi:hypothetical protein [Virgibacillus sp. DJP39]|uniref:hypothetical protein n=1 Tax=Virgibacillus sp. DJP39 TaxID=3409790 RepID=UPI003BB76CE3